MYKKKTLLYKFSVFNLTIIAIVSALGVATKPIVVPLIHIITGPLLIPGGAIAGGFYMMWIVIGVGVVKKFPTGTLIGIVQAILVIATGTMGSHGIMSIVSYTLPGLGVDIAFLFAKNKNYNILHYVFACMFANVIGTFISNIMFFRLPSLAVIFILSSAAMSGAIGGIIACSIIKSLEKMNINI
jgi:energy-coupling factor transport system substrate-specific component